MGVERRHTERSEIERLMRGLRSGDLVLSSRTTRELHCDGKTTVEILELAASSGHGDSAITWCGRTTEPLVIDFETSRTIVFAGAIEGDLKLNAAIGGMRLSGTTAGHVTALEEIDRGLEVSGEVSGSMRISSCDYVAISGLVGGNLRFVERVRGDIALSGEVLGNVDLHSAASAHDVKIYGRIGGDLRLRGAVKFLKVEGRVGGNVLLQGRISRGFELSNSGEVAGYLHAQGPLGAVDGSSVTVLGRTGGIKLSSKVAGTVVMSGAIGRSLYIDGEIWAPDSSAALDIRSHIKSNLELVGAVHGPVTLRARVDGRTVLMPSTRLNVVQLRCIFGETAHFGEGVQLYQCDFRGFVGYERLQLSGSTIFKTVRGRRTLERDVAERRVGPREMATWYRQLRKGMETNGDRAGATDFYFGECEARREALKSDRSLPARAELTILTAYKWMSGYGTRASFSLVWFALIAVISSVCFIIGGFNLPGEGRVSFRTDGSFVGHEVLLFTVQSMASFVRPPEGDLSVSEGYLQMLLRFAGPVLIAQAVLAVRERVAR